MRSPFGIFRYILSTCAFIFKGVMGIIITIDGPAGAGKSTTARALAEKLGFDFLDTGAMYRAVALACIRITQPPFSEDFLTGVVKGLQVRSQAGKVFLDQEEVTALIRSPEVTRTSGIIASSESVRKRMVELQRLSVEGKNVVCEGRDQGTVAFPKAQCKFFLTADAEARAQRRALENQANGLQTNLEELIRENQARDDRDAKRTTGPMVPAADAILLDNSQMDIDQVLALMEKEIRERCFK
ncbi:MAG: (d)CMP kinase [Gemmataceae bacterium]|nr:(d)CMP kinase [Gemmataceae bacterium]